MSSSPAKSLWSRASEKAHTDAPFVPAKRGANVLDEQRLGDDKGPPSGEDTEVVAKRARISSSGPAVLNDNDTAEPTISTPSTWSSSPPLSPTAAAPSNVFVGVDHVDANALKRALDFFAMADSVNGRYNITNIPLAAKWGDRYDTEKYLCDKGNRKLTCWVVGVVKSAWFSTSSGDPVPRVNVSVRPVRAADLEALHRLHGRSNPRPSKLPDRAAASRFQTRKVKGSAVPQAYEFDRIYNATVKFKAKSAMTKLPNSRVGKGDFVLLETFVNRYRTAGDQKGWKEWNVALELNELSVVFEAPDGFVDTDDEPITLEVDDDI